jgi:hypothetical protein
MTSRKCALARLRSRNASPPSCTQRANVPARATNLAPVDLSQTNLQDRP